MLLLRKLACIVYHNSVFRYMLEPSRLAVGLDKYVLHVLACRYGTHAKISSMRESSRQDNATVGNIKDRPHLASGLERVEGLYNEHIVRLAELCR